MGTLAPHIPIPNFLYTLTWKLSLLFMGFRFKELKYWGGIPLPSEVLLQR